MPESNVINVMEQMVDEKLEELLAKSDCCKCKQCVDDMRAIALNHLKPKYVSTDAGVLYTRVAASMEKQSNMDINVAVYNAIDIVSANPHHDLSENNNNVSEIKDVPENIDVSENKKEE